MKQYKLSFLQEEARQENIDGIDLLINFFNYLKDDLNKIVQDEMLVERYSEFIGDTDFNFKVLFEQQQKDIGLRIEEIVKSLKEQTPNQSKKFNEKLNKNGLTGIHLTSKMHMIGTLAKASEAPRLLRRRLSYRTIFLKFINSLLGSISKVIPAVEAIKEYKDQIEVMRDVQRI